jgi:predicted DsbA family dithiol-disulfide isomerase
MPAEGEEVHAHMAAKYGTTPDESKHTLAQMTHLGAELGFAFDFFDGFKMVNTRDAHILLDFAKQSGKQTELQMRLFKAFFCEQKDVSDREILAQELQKLGINERDGLARLKDDTVRNNIQVIESYYRNAGISAVPTMIFNQTRSLTGAQPMSTYRQVLSSYCQDNPAS